MRTVKGLVIYMVFAVIAVLAVALLPWETMDVKVILSIVAVFLAIVCFVIARFIRGACLYVLAAVLIGFVVIGLVVIPLLKN